MFRARHVRSPRPTEPVPAVGRQPRSSESGTATSRFITSSVRDSASSAKCAESRRNSACPIRGRGAVARHTRRMETRGNDAGEPPSDGPVQADVPERTHARPPGRLLTAVTLVLAVGITFAAVDWWPGASRGVDAFTNGLILIGLGGLLLVVGLVWAIKTLYVVGRDRRWSWSIVAMPRPSLS